MKGPNANETVVFVGNIPYDQTEEQILDILSSAGPVVNFRLVLDKDNGRSKGYGFVQYHDPETAASAVRNLNNYPIDNRRLKVDFSHESTIMSTKPSKAGELDETETLLASLPTGVVPPPQLSTAQAISSALFSFSANEVLSILQAIKSLSVSDPHLLRELFRTAPQLSYAIVQCLLLFGLRETSMVTDIVDPDYGRPSSNTKSSTPSGSSNRPSSRNDLFKPPIASAPSISQQPPPSTAGETAPPTNPLGVNSNQTPDQKAALLKQVASLSEDQIALFPPEQRQALLDLKGKIQRGEL